MNKSQPGPGFRLGEYTLGGLLGHGSMAAVYLARDRTGHEVALKIFREADGVSATMLERFRREAEAAKKLRRHPYILTVYSAGQQDEFHFIAMERIPNSRTLDDLLDEGTIGLSSILSLIVKLGNALHYAHEHHIVHRDVKPSNIMIDEFGEPLLTDFGVAELIDWPSCTVSGALTGTPMYMSPEQARADRVGPLSDQYSLAVVAYEALTGELPYTLPPSPMTGSVLEAVKTQTPRPPRQLNKAISRDLEFVLLKALSKDIHKRYADMKSFMNDLEVVLQGRPLRTRLLSPFSRLHWFVVRHRAALLLILGAVMLASVLGLYVQDQLSRSYQEQLISLARQRDAEKTLAIRNRAPNSADSQPTIAWESIASGRERMKEEGWGEAALDFEAAITNASLTRDARTLTIARVEAARCYWMLNEKDEAEQIYLEVIRSESVSPAMTGIAFFECLGLLAIQNRFDDLEQLYAEIGGRQEGPFFLFASCLQRKMAVNTLLDVMPQIPQMFQNDALLAIAVREHRDGHQERALEALRRSRKLSRTPEDWPAPLIAQLEQELGAM